MKKILPHSTYKRYSTIPDNERKAILGAYASGSSMEVASALFGYNANTCRWLLKDAGIPSRGHKDVSRQHAVDETFFDFIDTEEKAYWMGFILADGYIHRVKGKPPGGVGIRLASVDRGHLEKFKKALSSEHPIRHEVHTQSPNSMVKAGHHSDKILIFSQRLAASLGKLGIVPAKSKIVKPYLDLPENLCRHYWRGVVDGDGSLFFHHISWGVALVGTEAVVSAYRDFLLVNGVETTAQVRPDGSIFVFKVAGSRVSKQVADLLYRDATIYLDRKYECYKQVMAAPTKHQDLSAYSREDLEAFLDEYGNWKAVAAALNLSMKQVGILREKLGMPFAPYVRAAPVEYVDKANLTAEDLVGLLEEYGTWIKVAAAIGSSPRYLRALRQRFGMSVNDYNKKIN